MQKVALSDTYATVMAILDVSQSKLRLNVKMKVSR